MSTPFDLPPLPLTDDDRAAWGRYERANAAAAREYVVLPVAFNRAGEGLPCQVCHRRATRAKSGVCPACRRGAR